MPPGKHAVLGASSAYRWLACPPSARLCEKLDARFGAKESEYAREGTKAHALGEIKIRYAVWHADHMTAAKHGALSPEERAAYPGINRNRYHALRTERGDIPDDMEKATDTYCDIVMEKYLAAKEDDPSARLLLEQQLDYSFFVPQGFGTGDCVIVSDSLLEVCDYKHGRGIQVDVHGNPQLRLYALGALQRFGALYDFDAIRYTIIQPRIENVVDETTDREELLTWAEEYIKPRAQLAWEGKGEFVPGDHCRFCAAKAVCAARAAQALHVFDDGLAPTGELSDEQLARLLPYLDQAEAWIKDVRTYTEECAIRGVHYRGYKLVRGKRPNRAWSDPEEVKAQLLRSGYGAEQFEETKLRSVGDVEKTIGRKAFRALLSDLVKQGEGRLQLVPESDNRPEYNSAEAAFSDLEVPKTDNQ